MWAADHSVRGLCAVSRVGALCAWHTGRRSACRHVSDAASVEMKPSKEALPVVRGGVRVGVRVRARG